MVLEYLIFWQKEGLVLTGGTSFLKNYAAPIIHQLSAAFNNMVNPFIYLARMQPFRRKVLDFLRGPRKSDKFLVLDLTPNTLISSSELNYVKIRISIIAEDKKILRTEI